MEEHAVYLQTHTSPGVFLYFPSGRKVCCNYSYSSHHTPSKSRVADSSLYTGSNMHGGVDAGAGATVTGINADMETGRVLHSDISCKYDSETMDVERDQDHLTIAEHSTERGDLQGTSDIATDTTTATTAAAAAAAATDDEVEEPAKEGDDIWRECSSDEESSEGENESKPDIGDYSADRDITGEASTASATAASTTATAVKPSIGLRGRATQGTAKLQIHAASEGTVAFLLIPQLASLTTVGLRSRPWLSGVDKPGFITREEERRRSYKPVPVSLASCKRFCCCFLSAELTAIT